ncbi:MAG: competence/damage-inducible protein A [Candidatus Omnitrophota bacterium]
MDNKATVICIGNEIMLGHIANTNAQFISSSLSKIGIKTIKHLSIPDNTETIAISIVRSLYHSDIVIITGGLGPTVDDITVEALSKALDKELIFNVRVTRHIEKHFKKRYLKMPKNNMRQALVPKGAKYILNNIGTAPGLIVPMDKKVVIALPGVPFEMISMMEGPVSTYIKKNFKTGHIIKSRAIKMTGLPESRVNEKLEDILKLSGKVEMGIYPHPEEIIVKITATEKNPTLANKLIKRIEKKINKRMGNYIFGYDSELLEEVAGNLLLKKKKTISLAESCTGGLLANRITNVPGSSKYFILGTVTYSNASKSKVLGIPLSIIDKHGAVSKEVASLMAKNIRKISGADIGIGISGIAGPGGGTKKKPVGLVYITLSTKNKTICKKYGFLGQREIIKHKASQVALDLIRKAL